MERLIDIYVCNTPFFLPMSPYLLIIKKMPSIKYSGNFLVVLVDIRVCLKFLGQILRKLAFNNSPCNVLFADQFSDF